MLVLTVSQQYMSQVPSAHSHFIKLSQAHVNVWKRRGCLYVIKCPDNSYLTHTEWVQWVMTFRDFHFSQPKWLRMDSEQHQLKLNEWIIYVKIY